MAGEYKTTYELHPGWIRINPEQWAENPSDTPVYIEAALNTLADWLNPRQHWSGEAVRISPDRNHPAQVEFVLHSPKPSLTGTNVLDLSGILNPDSIKPVVGVYFPPNTY